MLLPPTASILVRLLVAACAASFSTASLADHMGPSGFGSGGGLLVLSPDTLDQGHGGLGFRLTYARPDHRSDAALQALAGDGIHAHNTDDNLNAAIGAAYGVTHQLTISAELPYVRRDHLREAETIDETIDLGNVSGLGDLSILAKYRLARSRGVAVALIGGIKLPTGSTHRRSRDGERLETEHQPGTGSWDPIFGASLGTTAGLFQVTASALYQIAGKGAQETRLGDRLQGGIALSHRFGEPAHEHSAMSHNHHHGDELDEGAEAHAQASWDGFIELSGEWEGRQKVAGDVEQASGGKSIWLAPGARFNSAGGYSVAASIGLPLWQDIRNSHPDNRYRVTLSIGRAF